MNDLIYLTASFHYEIVDSDMYGGIGSVGYVAINVGGIKDVSQIHDDVIETQKNSVAEMCHVSTDKVSLISKEKYDAETQEDDECDDTFDDDSNWDGE